MLHWRKTTKKLPASFCYLQPVLASPSLSFCSCQLSSSFPTQPQFFSFWFLLRAMWHTRADPVRLPFRVHKHTTPVCGKPCQQELSTPQWAKTSLPRCFHSLGTRERMGAAGNAWPIAHRSWKSERLDFLFPDFWREGCSIYLLHLTSCLCFWRYQMLSLKKCNCSSYGARRMQGRGKIQHCHGNVPPEHTTECKPCREREKAILFSECPLLCFHRWWKSMAEEAMHQVIDSSLA